MYTIVIVFEYPTVNGGENSMLAVLKWLTTDNRYQSRMAFHAIAPGGGELAARLDELAIPQTEFDRESLPGLVQATNAKVVHGNSLSMGRLLGSLSQDSLAGIRRTAHLRDIMRLSAAAIRSLNNLDRIITVSQATRDFHVKQGLDADRTEVIWNGIDPAPFTRSETARCEIRSELGIKSDEPVVLSVGQIGLRKGFDTLAEAAVLLSQVQPGVHYLLAGQRFSTKEESIQHEQRIHEIFNSAGDGLHFHPLGFRPDVVRLMSAADILVHPARQEPLGRVLLEAAAARLPIIATDVGGTREILCNQVSALLIPPDDPGALADRMQTLLSDRTRSLALGDAARQRIEKSFSVSGAATALADCWLDSRPT